MKTPHSFKQHRLAVALALALIGTQALAVSTTTENGTVIDFSSTLSFGAQVRLKSPNPQSPGQ